MREELFMCDKINV